LINREKMQSLRTAIERELEELGRKHGVQFKVGNGSYDQNGSFGHFKLEIANVNDQGEVTDQFAENFKRLAKSLGLLPDDLGKRFTSQSGETFKIVGLNPRATKMPVIAENVNSGRPFKFSARSVRIALGRLQATGLPPGKWVEVE